MKTNNASDDESFRGLLKEWNVTASLPPRFQEAVWRRIESEETRPIRANSPWAVMRNWIANALPRPALAVAYVVVLLAAGAGMGWSHARHESARVRSQLSEQYVRIVDPLLGAR